jgi:hypothetical protein
MSRTKSLKELLAPITWSWGSSIKVRQLLVDERHKRVRDVYSFMSKKEKELADKWFKEESHEGLWD